MPKDEFMFHRNRPNTQHPAVHALYDWIKRCNFAGIDKSINHPGDLCIKVYRCATNWFNASHDARSIIKLTPRTTQVPICIECVEPGEEFIDVVGTQFCQGVRITMAVS